MREVFAYNEGKRKLSTAKNFDDGGRKGSEEKHDGKDCWDDFNLFRFMGIITGMNNSN